MEMVVSLLFQSFAYGSTLYLIAAGLSLTLGLMRFANFAHGVLAMGGGYFAAYAMSRLGLDWYIVVLLSPAIVAGVSVIAEWLIFRHMYERDQLEQILLSIGLIYMAMAAARYLFGSTVLSIPLPRPMLQSVDVLGFSFQANKLFLSTVGCGVAAALLWWIENTKLGAIVRATVENRGMAESVGIRTQVLFSAMFALGAALAGLGGVLGAELFPIYPNYALDVLVLITIVVALAGLGTVRGVFTASIATGFVQTLGVFLIPEAGNSLLFFSVFAFLLWRPQGMYGARG